MGVDISDLADRSLTIHANWWQWRPAVELIRSLELFDQTRLDQLSNGIGQLTATETQQVADGLRRVLPGLQTGKRILLDGRVTDQPDDGTFHREPENQHLNYSLDYDWLNRFVAFCTTSRGLYVY